MRIFSKLLAKLGKLISIASDTSLTDDKSKDKIPKCSGRVWLSGTDDFSNLGTRQFKK